jgi:hypothetical protein
MLPSEQSEEVGGLSNLTDSLSAANVGRNSKTDSGEEDTKFHLQNDENGKRSRENGMNKEVLVHR